MNHILILAVALLIAPHVSSQTTGPDGDFGLVFRDLLAFKPSSQVRFIWLSVVS